MPAEKPSDAAFVLSVEPQAAQSIAERLKGLGSVERLDEQRLLLRTPEKRASPLFKDAWRRVVSAVGAQIAVYPVIVGDLGEERFPTGSVAVRFSAAPDGRELARFAKAHELRVQKRNQFVDRQIAFEPISPSKFLPDLVSEIEEDDRVERAWAETISHYRRG